MKIANVGKNFCASIPWKIMRLNSTAVRTIQKKIPKEKKNNKDRVAHKIRPRGWHKQIAYDRDKPRGIGMWELNISIEPIGNCIKSDKNLKNSSNGKKSKRNICNFVEYAREEQDRHWDCCKEIELNRVRKFTQNRAWIFQKFQR